MKICVPGLICATVWCVASTAVVKEEPSTTIGPHSQLRSDVDEESELLQNETAACVDALFNDGLDDILKQLIENVDLAVKLAELKGCKSLAQYLAYTGTFGKR